MPEWLVALLAVLFFVHLMVFARLAVQRGGAYYSLVTFLFLALTASFGTRLAAPGWLLAGHPLYQWLRYLAWAIAAVTLPWLVLRLVRRRRASRIK